MVEEKGMKAEILITEGLDYFSINHTPAAIEKLSHFMRELERWNRHVNLTARHPIDWMVRGLLYDAFFLFDAIKGAASVLDVGSGSGILAIPIALLESHRQVFSVDRTLKKIQFQRHIKRDLDITGLNPIHGRVEELDPLQVDALVAKGFGPARSILEQAGRHVKKGGRAFLLKGRSEKACAHEGFSLEQTVSYSLPGSPKDYRLFTYKKVS